MTTAENTADREIVSTRLINASRERVFQAWIDPEQLKHWWGPRGFTNTFHEFDARPGGQCRYVMHGPEGKDYPNHSAFVEIVRPERIVLDHISNPKFRLTGTFVEKDGKTLVTFQQVFITREIYEAVKDFARPGNEQNLERLEVQVTNMGKATQ